MGPIKYRKMNSYMKWSNDEEDQLKMLFSEHSVSIPKIASIHKRSEEAIKLRLIKLELLKEEDGQSEIIRQLCVRTNSLEEKVSRMGSLKEENLLEMIRQLNIKCNKCEDKVSHIELELKNLKQQITLYELD